jgi:transposase InsO family protein
MQNGRIESFHGKLRDEFLNVNWFRNLFDARRKIALSRREYNERQPHSSLGYLTPQQAAQTAAGSLPFPVHAIVLHRGHPSTLPSGSLTLGLDGA